MDAFYASLGGSNAAPLKKPGTPARSAGPALRRDESLDDESPRRRSSTQSNQSEHSGSRRSSTGSVEYTYTFEVDQAPFRPRRAPLEELVQAGHAHGGFEAYGPQRRASVDAADAVPPPREGINDLRELACKRRETFVKNWEDTLNSRREDLQKLEEGTRI